MGYNSVKRIGDFGTSHLKGAYWEYGYIKGESSTAKKKHVWVGK